MFTVEDRNASVVAATSTFDAACERAIRALNEPSCSVADMWIVVFDPAVAVRRPLCRLTFEHGRVVLQQLAKLPEEPSRVGPSLAEWTDTVSASRDAEWARATGRSTPDEAKQHLDELWEERDALMTENRRLLAQLPDDED